MDAIERAIQIVGTLTAFARQVGVSPQVVTHWRKRGIPAERVIEIERVTAGKVSRHELRPDLYPIAKERAA